MTSTGLTEAYSEASRRLRAGDRDRWLANLLVPPAARPHLDALYAYDLELAGLREIVTQPMLGEIRLQWWIDGLEGRRPSAEIASHPLGRALLDTVEKFRLPVAALTAMAEARRFDLYDDAMPTMTDLEGYCGETVSVPMRLASLVLADGTDPGGADATGHAGVAYGLAKLLQMFPRQAARGQVFLPADLLQQHGVDRATILTGRTTPGLKQALAAIRADARRHLAATCEAAAQLDKKARPALLPAALVNSYLKPMDRRSYDPFTTLIDTPPWRLQWALWRASRRL